MMEFGKPAGKFFGIMALGLGLALGCGEDDKKDEKKSAAASLSLVEQMLADACAENGEAYVDCSRSKPASFWQRDETPWNDNAQTFTIQIGTKEDPSKTDWFITDDSTGTVLDKKVIKLKQGLPVILKMKQVEGGKKHYLTAPVFFNSSVFRKVQTNDGEYKSSTFNAVENLAVPGSIDMYFIPMETGSFDGYCQMYVKDVNGDSAGADYVGLKAGQVELDFATGHAGATGEPKSKMYLEFIVEGEHNVSLEAHDSTRNTSYNGHAWGNDKDKEGQDGALGSCLWGKDQCTEAGGTKDTPIEVFVKAVNTNDGKMHFEELTATKNDDGDITGYTLKQKLEGSTKLMLTKDKAHILRFISEDTKAKHYLTAPELYKTSVFRKAMDSVSELKADYFKAVELLKAKSADFAGGKYTELYFVPRKAGDFEATCTEDDHVDLGMKFTISVQ